jgi:hypothetical protein
LDLPSTEQDSVHDRDECGDSEAAIHYEAHGTERRGAEVRLESGDGASEGRECCLLSVRRGSREKGREKKDYVPEKGRMIED